MHKKRVKKVQLKESWDGINRTDEIWLYLFRKLKQTYILLFLF